MMNYIIIGLLLAGITCLISYISYLIGYKHGYDDGYDHCAFLTKIFFSDEIEKMETHIFESEDDIK